MVWARVRFGSGGVRVRGRLQGHGLPVHHSGRVRVRVRVGVRAWPTRAPLRRCVRVTSWGRLRGLVRVRVEVGG